MPEYFEETGEVTQVYEKTRGFKLKTDDPSTTDVWFNLSKLGDAAKLQVPAKGERIAIQYVLVNGKPFVEAWHPEPSDQSIAVRVATHMPRDDKPVVTRLACLNAAIATLGHFGNALLVANADDPYVGSVILGLAERYVAWATWGGNAGQSVPVAGNPLEVQSLSNEPEREPGGASAGLSRSG